ncbi:MAG: sigma-E processing peptidase SpoIIGA [Candidatus Pelethousia sp.]|nr:sigma-E processing peptidase SpoIIGA [Candidatus Pelethousia sp.]
MYIELFLLDNALMDWIILRLAAALRGRKIAGWHTAAGCILGALYALLAVYWQPAGSLPGKAAFGCALALAFSPKGFKDYALCVVCLFGAAFAVGGLAFALALTTGGRMEKGVIWSGLPLRTALCIALLASFLPRMARSILRRRQQGHVRLEIEHRGACYRLEAMIDSGSSLFDPLSGLPVIVAYLPALSAEAHLPIPAQTLGGSGILYALRPQRVYLDGAQINAVLALSAEPLQRAQALVPPAAMPNATGERNL